MLEPDSGGGGDIASTFDGIRGAMCSTSIDLASIFTQLEITVENKRQIAHRDADGDELWTFNWCGCGLKALSFGLRGLRGGGGGAIKRKSISELSRRHHVHTSVDGHKGLVEKVLERIHLFGLPVNLAKSHMEHTAADNRW